MWGGRLAYSLTPPPCAQPPPPPPAPSPPPTASQLWREEEAERERECREVLVEEDVRATLAFFSERLKVRGWTPLVEGGQRSDDVARVLRRVWHDSAAASGRSHVLLPLPQGGTVFDLETNFLADLARKRKRDEEEDSEEEDRSQPRAKRGRLVGA